MARRPQAWIIVERPGPSGESLFDLYHGRREILTSLLSRTVAEETVARYRKDGERVWFEESDGYRTELTRRFAARPYARRR